MKKVLFVATVVKTHIMEFHIPYLKMFKERGWETAVAARNDYEDPADCEIPYCDRYYDISFERSPLKRGNFVAYKALKSLINSEGYDIIHCHTPVGGVLTRLAARKARRRGTRVIYTAHGFHFCKGAPLTNWLLYYPVERWLAGYTDVLITINQEDWDRARRFKAGRVCFVLGVGVDLKKFRRDESLRAEVRGRLQKEFGIPEDSTVVLSVGELIKRKNHRAVIRALGEVADDSVVCLLCGRGPLMEDLRALADRSGLGSRVIMAGYRRDIEDMLQAADIFVFPSRQEGLPVALMEAMAAGLPVIATDIRGCRDLITDPGQGVLLNPEDVKSFAAAISRYCRGEEGAAAAEVNPRMVKPYELEAVMKEYGQIYFGQEEV